MVLWVLLNASAITSSDVGALLSRSARLRAQLDRAVIKRGLWRLVGIPRPSLQATETIAGTGTRLPAQH